MQQGLFKSGRFCRARNKLFLRFFIHMVNVGKDWVSMIGSFEVKAVIRSWTWARVIVGILCGGMVFGLSMEAKSACKPAPDCEALGYTARSCVGGGVKCPWDLTKMYCNPNMCSLTITKEMCDSECKEVGAQSCFKNGKTYYAECGASKCGEGQGCNNGSCVACDNSCGVGSIVYSDFSCSSCYINTKTPIGVVTYADGDNRLAIQLDVSGTKLWSNTLSDVVGIDNVSSSTYKSDMDGKANTQAWVSQYGSSNNGYAAGYCYNYTTPGTGKGQWHLPSAGELTVALVTNKSAVSNGLSKSGGEGLQSGNHWSSSEQDASKAWKISSSGGTASDKYSAAYVRCMMHFGYSADGEAENCGAEYKYTCSGSEYTGGSGVACGGKYQSCVCANGASWNGTGCGCDDAYKFSCSGTNITGGDGKSCDGKYVGCKCSNGANWNGSSCVCDSSYRYSCSGTGYSGGVGSTCGGKYQECSCGSDYNWSGMKCECKPEFKFLPEVEEMLVVENINIVIARLVMDGNEDNVYLV